MTSSLPSPLIDENELRAALAPWCPNSSDFEAGIRQRIEQAAVEPRLVRHFSQTALAPADWISVAACVVPVPLLGKSASVSLIKLGQLSLGKKLVALMALPAIGLLLMITATIWALLKIRRAQLGAPVGEVDASVTLQVTGDWWKRFGLLVVGVSLVSLVLMQLNYSLPVFVIFLTSGIAMLSLIGRLGRAGLVDRQTLGGALGPGLLILGQLTQSIAVMGQRYPLLDPMLIPAVLLLGSLIIFVLCQFTNDRLSGQSWVRMSFLGVGLLVLVGWLSSSLWLPITTNDLKKFVQGFDEARFASASWEQWRVPAQWLRDSHVPFDADKPRALLLPELSQVKPDPYILCSAIEAGLMQPADIENLQNYTSTRNRLFDESVHEQSFVSLDRATRFFIQALQLRGDMNERERDYLGKRLALTMESIHHKDFVKTLSEQLAITQLAQCIGRPLDKDAQRQFVHQTLVNHQRLSYNLGSRAGGFATSEALGFSDLRATADAIELMEIYGVPDGVRLDALRSYLRPSMNDRWPGLWAEGCIRFACRERLESLAGIEPLSLWDYVQQEQSLMMASLFTLIAVFATAGARTRVSS